MFSMKYTAVWTIIKNLVVLCSILIGIYSIYAMQQTLNTLESRVELHRQALIEIGTFLEKQYGNDVE